MTPIKNVLLDPALKVGADLAAYRAAGGGEGLANAIERPEAILTTLEAAGLRGLGGAGFPTFRKWGAVRASVGDDKVVVCNGNEDEPGTFKDRELIRSTPHQVIEGALIAALAVGANDVIFYVNPHQAGGLAAIGVAASQWQGSDLLEGVATSLGRPVTLAVRPSSGRYIGGEETAVVSWLDGGFPFPKPKPPFPFEKGVGGRPTLINNTETFANVPHILRHGADWFRELGIGEAVGTKLYSLSGDVLNPVSTSCRWGRACGISSSGTAAACWRAGPSRPSSPEGRRTPC